MSYKWPDKDPDEILDYSVDWSRYLGSDTLVSVQWYAEDADGVKTVFNSVDIVNGLQHISSTNTSTVSTIQLSLGQNNTTNTLYCEITTAGGVTTERKIKLKVRQRT
jgi:hypothetical protein